MDITKVVIHSLDLENRRVAFSEKQLNLNTYSDTIALIEKVTKSFLRSSTVSSGYLQETSQFKAIINSSFDFMGTARAYAKAWYDRALMGEELKPSSMIFAQIDHGETVLLVAYEMKSRQGYVGSLHQGLSVDNTLVHESNVISATLGSVNSGFVIDLQTGETLIKVSGDQEDDMMELMDIEIQANTKKTFTIIDGLVRSIALRREEDPNLNVMKAKQVVSDNMVILEEIRPLDLISAVFTDLNLDETTQIEKGLEEGNAIDQLQLKDLKAGQTLLKHKLSTESGIEISVPVSDVNLANLYEIVTEENGQVNIIIKNVGKVI